MSCDLGDAMYDTHVVWIGDAMLNVTYLVCLVKNMRLVGPD